MSRILGIDFGTVRVGLALSDELELVATPWQTLSSSPNVAQEVAQLVRQKHVTHIVLGAPLTMSGQAGAAMERTERFATALRRQLPDSIEVELIDERLSSKTAEAALKDQGHSPDTRSGLVDQLAATVILQDYLNSKRGPDSYLLPEDSFEMPWMEVPRKKR
jgi:putative holliday junction resolvase